jgi:hypothetical protein
MVGENFDLSSEPPGGREPGRAAGPGRTGPRPFLGVHFACCGVYARVYLNREQTAYNGHCPRCSRRVQFLIGAEGTQARFFTAY